MSEETISSGGNQDFCTYGGSDYTTFQVHNNGPETTTVTLRGLGIKESVRHIADGDTVRFKSKFGGIIVNFANGGPGKLKVTSG